MLRTTIVLGALALISPFASILSWADEPQPNVQLDTVFVQDEPRFAITQAAPENTPRLEVAHGIFLNAATEPASKFWIGLGCELATDALKSQLGLAEKPAILVTMVADDSPAKTAGFEVHDVLISVKLGEDTTLLENVATLTNFVTKAEQKPMTLSVVRQGKPQEITVTPAERPQPKDNVLIGNIANLNVSTSSPATAANSERAQVLLRELQSVIAAQQQPTTIHFTGPVVAPPSVPTPPNVPHIVVMSKAQLPDDVTITITKKGKDPTRIKYQQGGVNSWGATETEINTLPPEGRSALQTVLAALHQVLPQPVTLGYVPPSTTGMSEWPVRTIYKTETIKGQGLNSNAGVTGVIATKVAPPQKSAPQDTTGQLQALEKRTDLMQKQLQELIHMTKQQETLHKELQSLREMLEKVEKK